MKKLKNFSHENNGALGRTRTGTPQAARILSPLCLPIPPRGHIVSNCIKLFVYNAFATNYKIKKSIFLMLCEVQGYI